MTQSADGSGTRWDDLGVIRELHIARTRIWLDAIAAAGLAVVELPDPDRWITRDGGEITPSWDVDPGETVTAWCDGVETDRGLIENLDELRIAALKMLAAIAACERYRREGDRS